jgi:hypothetical protein
MKVALLPHESVGSSAAPAPVFAFASSSSLSPWRRLVDVGRLTSSDCEAVASASGACYDGSGWGLLGLGRSIGADKMPGYGAQPARSAHA